MSAPRTFRLRVINLFCTAKDPLAFARQHQADPSVVPRLAIAVKPLRSTGLSLGPLARAATAIERMVVGREDGLASESEV